MNTESLKMKNTKQKACHIVTGFSLWRRTRDSLSLRFPNHPSQRYLLGFFDRCTVLSLVLSSAGRTRSKRSRRETRVYAALDVRIPALHKKKVSRGSVRPFSGGGQEIRTLAPRQRPTPLAGEPLHHLSNPPCM